MEIGPQMGLVLRLVDDESPSERGLRRCHNRSGWLLPLDLRPGTTRRPNRPNLLIREGPSIDAKQFLDQG